MIQTNEPVQWLADGSPYSHRFNDRYRSRTGGLAQAWTVFLQGCGLPDGWQGKSDFRILETGFGLGLNFLATWSLWEADERRSDRVHYCSVDAFPVAAAEIIRNARTCEQSDLVFAQDNTCLEARALELADAWMDITPGINHLSFSGGRFWLTLAVGEVLPMLKALNCKVNAVYLDGFSPALNPAMWSPSTLQAVAGHCVLGTRLATWTVAKPVRVALQANGFQVKKRPGLPPKRDRLECVYLPEL